MNTIVFGTGPQPFQHFPYLKDREKGIALWFRGGHVVSPRGGWALRPEATAAARANWFNAIPKRVIRYYVPLPILPFLTVRYKNFGFYIGWKAFGLDSDAYKDYPGINPAEVHDGSVALTGLTARFTTKLPPITNNNQQ